MKKPAAIILVFTLLFSLCACAQKDPSAPSDPAVSEPERFAEIFDREGTRLGQIDGRAVCTAVDAGIFYSVFEPEDGAYTGPAAYHYFNMDTKADVPLGTLKDQGYEAAYARTELDGIIYTLAVTGNVFGDAPTPLLLLAFDPAAGTMKQYTVSETGFPYAAMAAADGKLFIMNHEMTEPKSDTIYVFDPKTETISPLLSFDAQKDSLRGVAALSDGFCLLRLVLQKDAEPRVFLDRYDEAGEKRAEAALTEPLVNAALSVHGVAGRADALNELSMNVSRFLIVDDRYLVYENFGLTRLVLDLLAEKTLFAREDVYSVSSGSGRPILYRMDFDADRLEEPELLEPKNGELARYDFTPVGKSRLIQSVSRSPGGTFLVRTAVRFPLQDAESALFLWTDS